MKILYCAIDQTVPGTTGGSVHVRAVADGLAALGHEVHVLASRRNLGSDLDFCAQGSNSEFESPQKSGSGPRWIAMSPPLGLRQLRWARASAVRRIADVLQPDVVIERYYNFGGEGITAGRHVGATTVLEVNAPVIDHPGSTKALIDKALIVQPMRRWRERLCNAADLIITPSAAILPESTPPHKIIRLEWGADTERFRPDVKGALPFTLPPGTVAVFAGAFRSWHGAINLVRAIRDLRARGRRDVSALFIGDGPELGRVRREAAGVEDVVFAGAVPHERMPVCLAAADVGVAPFDRGAHRPLSLGFYWSPLKIFEYMAAGLPVVAPAVDRIPSLVSHGHEGVLYDPLMPGALASALEQLTDSALRARLGAAARDRAVHEYSWRAHCRALDEAMARARL